MDIFTVESWEDAFSRAPVALLLEHFSELSDDREPQRVLYSPGEMLLPVVCATNCSREDFDDIVLWGRHHLHSLRRFSEFHFVFICGRWVRAPS